MEKVFYDKNEQKKIGMLTPSSNTTLEPICSKMVSGLEKIVTMHYSRLKVTKISLEKDALSQFDNDRMLEAAKLLQDADVDVIAWNGTSGGWRGLADDREICKNIEEQTGIPATTCMLSQMHAFENDGVKKIHLITPYTQDIHQKIIEQYKRYGIEVVNDICLKQYVNRSFALVDQQTIQKLFEQICTVPADGISVVCTNFPAMWSVPQMEHRYGITVYDTLGTLVKETLEMLQIDPGLVKGWGKLFEQQERK